MAGGGADELAGFPGKEFVDGACIGALDGFAGEDDGAAIDVRFGEAGFLVGAGDEAA